MNQKHPLQIATSIRARLLLLAKQNKEDFNLVLSRYAVERFLYRLSQSRYKTQFILKGATLFTVWYGEPHRATKDLDLLCYGSNDVSQLIEVFKAICRQPCEADGIQFLENTIIGEKIKEEQDYEGVRIKLLGMRS
jgi:predicted nucleotidyltransferase component of viral defense system